MAQILPLKFSFTFYCYYRGWKNNWILGNFSLSLDWFVGIGAVLLFLATLQNISGAYGRHSHNVILGMNMCLHIRIVPIDASLHNQVCSCLSNSHTNGSSPHMEMLIYKTASCPWESPESFIIIPCAFVWLFQLSSCKTWVCINETVRILLLNCSLFA